MRRNGKADMALDYDATLEEPEDDEACGIHEIPYRQHTGCPACRDEAEDRRHDERKEHHE